MLNHRAALLALVLSVSANFIVAAPINLKSTPAELAKHKEELTVRMEENRRVEEARDKAAEHERRKIEQEKLQKEAQIKQANYEAEFAKAFPDIAKEMTRILRADDVKALKRLLKVIRSVDNQECRRAWTGLFLDAVNWDQALSKDQPPVAVLKHLLKHWPWLLVDIEFSSHMKQPGKSEYTQAVTKSGHRLEAVYNTLYWSGTAQGGEIKEACAYAQEKLNSLSAKEKRLVKLHASLHHTNDFGFDWFDIKKQRKEASE